MKTIVFLLAILGPTGALADGINLSCVGTEPFWSMGLTDSEITFINLGGDREVTTEVKSVDVPAGVKPEYAFEIIGSNGMRATVVKTGNCSDGMSDTVYSHTVLLREGYLFYTGCCSVPKAEEAISN